MALTLVINSALDPVSMLHSMRRGCAPAEAGSAAGNSEDEQAACDREADTACGPPSSAPQCIAPSRISAPQFRAAQIGAHSGRMSSANVTKSATAVAEDRRNPKCSLLALTNLS